MNWYAVFVKTGEEDTIKRLFSQYFDNKILIPLVPKRKLIEKRNQVSIEVEKLIIPGYVLIKTNMNSEIFSQINSLPNIYKVLTNGTYSQNDNYFFAQILDFEIQRILDLTNKHGIIEFSQIYIENSQICVKSGPLKGMEGIIKKINNRKKRAKIQLQFMGEEKLIDIGIEFIENTSSS